jgi:hypothetical protein
VNKKSACIRKLCLIAANLIAVILSATQVSAQSDDIQAQIDRLERKKAAALQQLAKTENGRSPCYTEECQRKKFNIVSTLSQRSQLIPEIGERFLKNRDEGIASAYRLVRKKFEPPVMAGDFPASVHEWSEWWVRRYNHEQEIRSGWMRFVSDVRLLYFGFQFYLKLDSASEEQRELIQDAWDRGLAEAAKHLVAMATFAEQVGFFRELKDKEQEKAALLQALSEQKKYNEINERFEGQIHSLLLKLFPQASNEEQVTAFLILMSDWLERTQSKSIFDSAFKEEMEWRNRQAQELYRTVLDFQDLEYGIVGLNNFYSPVNPAVAAELEIPLQEFLDSFDYSARAIVELGASYFTTLVGRTVFGVGVVSDMLLPTATNLIGVQKNFNLTEALWSKSGRTKQLTSTLPLLEAEMEKRRIELFINRRQFQEFISQTDLELTRLKGGQHQ